MAPRKPLFSPQPEDDKPGSTPDPLSDMIGKLLGGKPPEASPSPIPGPTAPSEAAPGQTPAPMGQVPKTFEEYLSNPVNVEKIPVQNPGAPMPTMAAAGTPPGPGLNSPNALASPPAATSQPSLLSKPDFLKANPANIPAPPPQYKGGRLFGMGLATAADNIGAALSGGHPSVGPAWMQNVQAGQEYARNLPVMRSSAETAAYDQYLKQQGEAGTIGATAASTAHTQAETKNLELMDPFYAKGAELKNEIQQMWQSGSMDEPTFDKAVALKLQGNPYSRLIGDDVIKQIKSLPKQPPSFKIEGGAVQPLTWQGKQYGVTPEPNEPQEITASRRRAISSQQSGEFSKAPPGAIAQYGPYPVNGTPEEQTAWGKNIENYQIHVAAAPKIIVQAATQANQAANNPSAVGSVAPHLVGPATAAYEKAGVEYATANQAAQNMQEFIREAKSGNKEAVKMVPLQGALEITTAQGVHRINRTEVDQFGGAGSLFDKLEGKVTGVFTGKDINDSVLNDMAALQQAVSKNAGQLHKNKVAVINQTYGSKFTPMQFDQPAAERKTYQGSEYEKQPDGTWKKVSN